MMLSRTAKANGSVLVLCLMVLAVLSVMGLWALKIASLNRMTSLNHVRQLQALYLAEAGIDLALAAIRENPLWRGTDPTGEFSVRGTMVLRKITGTYAVIVSDATDDDNGKWDPRLAGGTLCLFSEGGCAGAYQSLSCNVSISPSAEKTGCSPRVAVMTSGHVAVSAGSAIPVGLDSLGRENPVMIRSNGELPPLNRLAFQAMADDVIASLDDEAVDRFLSDRHSFWRESATATHPFITWVSGDMIVSGEKTLYGIFFVEGDRVTLSDKARLFGVVFAPNARVVTLPPCQDPASPPIKGQIVAGDGEIRCSDSKIGVQLVNEYVDALNEIGGGPPTISIVPGSWHRL